jgi:hypothetical protein
MRAECWGLAVLMLVRFVVITAETMKITVFWSVVQCSLEDYY